MNLIAFCLLTLTLAQAEDVPFEQWNMFWNGNFETLDCHTGCLGKYSDVRFCYDYSEGKGHCCKNNVWGIHS